jgi:Cu-Zn family superoxide dismutase
MRHLAASALACATLATMGLGCEDGSDGPSSAPQAQGDKQGKAQAQAEPKETITEQEPVEKMLPVYVDPGAESPEEVEHAVAVMHPTKGNDVRGKVHFTKTDEGVRVQADVQGLPEGTHAYHVHLRGDCTGAKGKTAGTHFNFKGSSKNPPKDIDRITGNLGQLKAGSNGKAQAEKVIADAALQGQYSILGRSVIVHAKGNDPESPPIGAAGARLACGVIGLTEDM